MMIVAFDSECSRDFGNYCEMCSFGYVIADMDFNIVMSKRSLIRASKPTGRQKKAVRIPAEELASAPEYNSVYNMIADVFETSDAVFISHAPETDFRYLCCMNRRFGKENIRCKAFDLLTLVRNYADLPNYSLSGICKTFGIKYSRKEDNADAKACIDILRYICNEEKTSVQDILNVCGNGAVVDSEVINYRTLSAFKKERLNKLYNAKPTSGKKFSGVVFSMAESFEENRIELAFHIAETIVHYGGTITRKVSESHIFVWDGSIDSKRLESVNMNHTPIRIISTDELFSSDFDPRA